MSRDRRQGRKPNTSKSSERGRGRGSTEGRSDGWGSRSGPASTKRGERGPRQWENESKSGDRGPRPSSPDAKSAERGKWQRSSEGKPGERGQRQRATGAKPAERGQWQKSAEAKPGERGQWRKSTGAKPGERGQWQKATGAKPGERGQWQKSAEGKPGERGQRQRSAGAKPGERDQRQRSTGAKPGERDQRQRSTGAKPGERWQKQRVTDTRPGERGPRQSDAEFVQEERRTPASSAPPDGRHIIGRNPVIEALRANRRLKRIWLTSDQDTAVKEIQDRARAAQIPVEHVDRHQLSDLAATTDHQGVLALAPPFVYSSVESILARAGDEPPFILVLDHIEDPQNLGSLIRTAECAGAHGAIIPNRRAASVTPAVGKASAGAIEHLPIAQIGNVVQEIERLKTHGVWVVGAHMTGDSSLFEADLKGPVALVIGAEGRGLSRLVAERCDMLVSIPMQGQVSSLNASVAGALMMYEVRRSRLRPEA